MRDQRWEFGLLLVCFASFGLQFGMALAYYMAGPALALIPFIASIWFTGWTTVVFARWYADEWHTDNHE